jgi:hypothetical protein
MGTQSKDASGDPPSEHAGQKPDCAGKRRLTSKEA